MTDFFRYHGWLAPGVRLLRQLRFPGKASIIAGLFLIPLVMLLWQVWQGTQEQQDFTHSEQLGVDYVQSAHAVLVAAQNWRMAAILQRDPDSAKTKASQAWQDLQSTNRQLGEVLQTAPSFQAADKAFAVLQQLPSNAPALDAYRAHTAFVQALITLTQNVADNSQLSLDPELDTYHLMNYSVLVGPEQIEMLSRLQALSTMVLREHALPAELQAEIGQQHALLDFVDEKVEHSYGIAIESDKSISSQFDMPGVDRDREKFDAALREQVLSGSLGMAPEAFIAVAQASVNSSHKLNQQILQRLEQRLQERSDSASRALLVKFTISGSFIALALYMMLAFYTVMMGGLDEVSRNLDAIADGNLLAPPIPWGRDEAADLMHNMTHMVDKLKHIAVSTLQEASTLNHASSEIASTAADLSSRTESAASSLEETAAAMHTIGEKVQHSNRTVAEIATIVQNNANVARDGGQTIGEVVSTMRAIHGSSQKIADIIGVIDSIAFQTNILALNAAVEAARAGEQGRGFAVVASEVRALAGRSAEAAREIKQLITSSIEQVERGAEVADKAGATVDDIVTNAQRIHDMMHSITEDSRDQSNSVKQVGGALAELNDTTQHNASLVEESSAAAKNLAEQAQRLMQVVGFFKLA
ncbi:hypothetical protein KIK84_09615 [Curvibacter sp. CHRR-16]|uniref:methyl-accepting chemotaxis protein n=1 Tax=Curvibacter sp. CHRR-16 TaxID=2835872 RepID=UPI001BD9353F|nr:methyl-accepting chemotaxis protein [Curvibacter sp. CHRR-16]MBT0570587.1 hypothetical protein [Curvibacter sp. CHRR-16]